jgi:hypothetical protein
MWTTALLMVLLVGGHIQVGSDAQASACIDDQAAGD